MRFLGAAAVTAGLLVVPLASAAIFGRPAEIPLAGTPVWLVLGDATQDGYFDIVVANASEPTLTVLPGHGDGRFERPIGVGTGPTPTAVALGNFDNDGGDDFAVAAGSQVTLYVGVDGGLERRGSTHVRSPSALATTDLDSDGELDLVVGGAGGTVSVLIGVGDGAFRPAEEYPVGSPVTSLVVADFDWDEVPDVAAAGDGVSVLIGEGDGTLRAYERAGGPNGIRTLTGDDLDGDGDFDLVALHRPNFVTVLLNSIEGGFVEGGSYRVGGTPVAIVAVDVDSDSTTDLVTPNRGTNDVSVLLGFGNGEFREQIRFPVGRTPTGVASDDLDGDGTFDLVTSNRRSKSVTLMLNGVDAPPPVICLVPPVARRTLVTARRLVDAANCRAGPIRRKYSKRVRRGRVIAVTPVPGTRLPVDSAVGLLVSRGPRR